MALFFLLDRRVGFIPKYDKDKDGSIEPLTITLHFQDKRVNELIARWLKDLLDNKD